jgi:quercetin dioxygenase-like cupin family protein
MHVTTPHPSGVPTPPRSTATSSLLAITRQELRIARHATIGASTRTLCVHPTAGVLQQLVGLRAGSALEEDVFAGTTAWTVQVLEGRLRLAGGRPSWIGLPGDFFVGHPGAQQLYAERDTALLVTTVRPHAASSASVGQ